MVLYDAQKSVNEKSEFSADDAAFGLSSKLSDAWQQNSYSWESNAIKDGGYNRLRTDTE